MFQELFDRQTDVFCDLTQQDRSCGAPGQLSGAAGRCQPLWIGSYYETATDLLKWLLGTY